MNYPESAEQIPTGANTRLVLDGQPLENLVGFEYAKDSESYVVGKFLYAVRNENRPRAGARYRTLWLQWESEAGVWDTVFAANNVTILTEAADLMATDEYMVVECKWSTHVN
jgi:hypothetical protein